MAGTQRTKERGADAIAAMRKNWPYGDYTVPKGATSQGLQKRFGTHSPEALRDYFTDPAAGDRWYKSGGKDLRAGDMLKHPRQEWDHLLDQPGGEGHPNFRDPTDPWWNATPERRRILLQMMKDPKPIKWAPKQK